MALASARPAMRWLMAAFYLGAGLLHLARSDSFLPIVPDWVPAPRQVILLTGVAEIAGAIGLMIPRLRWWAGVGLALYALGVFPANIKHAFDGVVLPGLPSSWWYHGPRLVAQPILIWWALYAGGVTEWPQRRRSSPPPGSRQS